MKLSIVTTLFRSAPTLRAFHGRMTASARRLGEDYEIILVNDGSPDDSLDQALALAERDPHVTVVDLSRNFGHHRAIMTGLTYARGERVFLLDCDLEERPEWLAEFAKTLDERGCDVVYGVQERRKGGLFERATGAIFWNSIAWLSSTPVPRNLVTARLMTRRYVRSLLEFREQELFLGGVWALAGYEQVPLTVEKGSRQGSSYSLARRFALLTNSVTSFSDKPLVLIFYLGLGISGISGLLVLNVLLRKLVFAQPLLGWTSLIASIWFLSGLMLLSMGVIGIYLSKVFLEVKGRPYSIVRAVHGRDT